MIQFVWLIPCFCLLVLCFAVFNLFRSAKKYSRQDRNLKQKIKTFREHREAAVVPDYKARHGVELNLEQALERRKALQKRQAKAKSERQRRLVKRLNSLSKPKEDN